MKSLIILSALVTAAGLFCAGCAAVRAGYASAPYKTLRREGDFELRDYPALTLAETSLRESDGSFMRLFHFIGGQNAAKQRIAMTTPVIMGGTGTNATMAFVMPASASESSIPQPTEPAVVIKTLPSGTFAVLRFSGRRNQANEANAVNRLAGWLAQEKLSPIESPLFAYFDPPWTPAFLCRNEVMFRLAKPWVNPKGNG